MLARTGRWYPTGLSFPAFFRTVHYLRSLLFFVSRRQLSVVQVGHRE